MSEGETENNGNSNMILLRTPEGDLTFTFENDDRLEGAFKEWEQLCLLTPNQHQSILNTMNTCEWDKKVDYINGDIVKVEKYTAEEKAVILAEREKEAIETFFRSEKAVALKIEEDYRLELGVTDSEFTEVKLYIRAIMPNESKVKPLVTRPAVMYRYD